MQKLASAVFATTLFYFHFLWLSLVFAAFYHHPHLLLLHQTPHQSIHLHRIPSLTFISVGRWALFQLQNCLGFWL